VVVALGVGADAGLHAPATVGRDAEVLAVERSLVAVESGPSLLLIEGEAGIGKTTLWRETVRAAADRGWTTLTCRPAQSEARLSFSSLADLLAGVADAAFRELMAAQRHALEIALLRAEPSGRPPDPRLIATALLGVLRTLAGERPVLLAVDDVQWADHPSAAALEFSLRRLVAEPIAIVLSSRPGSEPSALARTLSDERTEGLLLEPLSAAALHRILAQRLGIRLSRPLLVRVARAAGGNPFYALEIARLLARDGIPGHGEALPLPDDLRALVAGRIGALPPRTRAALLLVAASMRPTLALVDASTLAPAEEAGLVQVAPDGRIAFAHPLFASAVYGAAPTANRRAVHLELADIVSDPEERARHLALASDAPDEGTARVVEDAARSALARGAPDAAAELTALALGLTPTGSAAADERRLALAEQLQFAGDIERASALLEQLRAELPPGDLRARVLLVLSELAFRRDGESVATSLAREAAETARDDAVRARCLAMLSNWAGTSDLPLASRAAQEALELMDGCDVDPGLVAFALANRIRADLFLGKGLDADAAERALELEEASLAPAAVDDRVVYRLGQWLRYTDDLAGARTRLAEAERAANDESDAWSLVNILLNQVVLETWAGNWELASALATRLAETGDQLGVDAERVWQAYLDAHVGRVDAVRVAAESADRSEPMVDMLYSRSLGLALLAAGESEEADAHLSHALEIVERVGLREPAIWRIDGDAIEAAITAGAIDRAEKHVAELERRAAGSGIPWSLAVALRGRALVLAARGDLDGAAVALEQALIAHDRVPMPFERARTLLVLGRVCRRLKRKRLAQEALTEALAIFEQLGASLWTDRARENLSRVTTRRAAEGLNPTELEIARLAAEGLTNKAIAERVFVTQKTVEANLARAYRKLGITSRAQLANALADAAS
jgi:DNA-binding CsgD family transcriptional regulator